MQQLINYIGPIIAILVIFGPIVANVIRSINQAQKRQQGSPPPDADVPPPSRRSRLDDMAARRRAELGGGRPSGAGGGDPANMTMAERIARARAQAQYQQRSDEMTRGGPSRPGADEVEIEIVEVDDPFASEIEAERRRREQDAELARRRAQERQRAEAAERRRREQAEADRQARLRRQQAERSRQTEPSRRESSPRRPRQTQAQRSSPRRSSALTRRSSAAGIGDLDADAITRGEVGTGQSAKRMHGEGGQSSGAPGGAAVFGVRLTRRTMRHAVVLREILDPPVALRQSSSNVG